MWSLFQFSKTEIIYVQISQYVVIILISKGNGGSSPKTHSFCLT